MSAPSSGDSRRVVLAALAGNVLIALAKFVAAALSGSAAMLAEGVHSLADTANQGLLLLGMGLSEKENPDRFPFGRAAERYFWAFVVALLLFSLGGAFAIYEGIHRLASPPREPESVLVSAAVLVVSLALEAGSFLVAVREFNRGRAGRPVLRALLEGRDPTIPIVLLEDTGAVFGLTIALVAVGVSAVTKSSVADAIGSLVIGVLLCGIGLLLAWETHGLLIGESATPEMRERAYRAAAATPGIDAITQMLTLHLGPDTIVLALKVRFPRHSTVEDVERITNELEDGVRVAVPEMKKIFVEADGHYDAALDPATRRAGARA
ncbi:MAG TPA: cation diffusion facilitator family transporter [Polyangiaceae bacterium]|nr:cation diffusion facilitator family transporter [Polyangiaceae bacterium]